MSINNLNLGNQSPIGVGDFLSMPVKERARMLSGISELALKSVEEKASNTFVPEYVRSQGIPATAQFLLDGHFDGSPTIGAVDHATDGDRNSLRDFEIDVHRVESMLDRPDMKANFESARTIENSRYTIFPELGIVFRDRTLAITERKGVKAVLAKRTTAVYNPFIANLAGGFSYNAVRRDNSVYHGSRLPDIDRLKTVPQIERTEDGILFQNTDVAIDALALDNIERRTKNNHVSFAGELRNELLGLLGGSETDKHKPPYVYLDLFEHAIKETQMRQIFDRAMIDAPRDKNPAKRKTSWLHVVSSQLYFKDL